MKKICKCFQNKMTHTHNKHSNNKTLRSRHIVFPKRRNGVRTISVSKHKIANCFHIWLLVLNVRSIGALLGMFDQTLNPIFAIYGILYYACICTFLKLVSSVEFFIAVFYELRTNHNKIHTTFACVQQRCKPTKAA